MATLYEYYNTGDNSQFIFYQQYWDAQTFTPSIAHKITSVKLKLFRYGYPGTITISIRATSVGHPTGSDLCSGTINGNAVTTNTSGAWYTITLGAGYNLAANTKYAIVARALSANGSSNIIYWRHDATSPTYVKGCMEDSQNSGSSWTSFTAYDCMFEEWGEPLPVTHYLSAVIAGSSSASGAILLTRGLAGVVAGSSVVSGALRVTYALSGLIQGASSVSGFIRVNRALSGVCSGASSVVADLTVAGIRWLSGVITGASSVSGFIRVNRALAGVVSGASSVSANLTNIKWLKGVIAGKASVAGSLSVFVIHYLSGVISGVCSVRANLMNIKWLAGLIAGVATVTGSLFHVRVAVRVLSAVRNLLALRNIPPVR